MPRAKRISEVKGVKTTSEFLPVIQAMDTVQKVPIYFGEDRTLAEKKIGLVNSRTQELVGVASDRWEPVTHQQAFMEVINSASDLMGDEFYGRIHNTGNVATMEILFGTVEGADKLAFGIRALNQYKVGSVFKLSSFYVRSACTNGMLWTDVSANMALNHLDRDWFAEIHSGVSEVVGQLSGTYELIGGYIGEAQKDRIDFGEFKSEVNFILNNAGISEERGMARLRKSQYALTGETITRYDLYNALTAFATHLTPSISVHDRIQRAATEVLQTPFAELLDGAQRQLQVGQYEPQG